jgi:hypothetical protein
MNAEENSVGNKIYTIFDILNIFEMKNYERVILNKDKKDIGLREDNRGAIYIVPKVYFQNEKVQRIIDTISKSGIVRREVSKK